jgi:chemotaxis protein CheD
MQVLNQHNTNIGEIKISKNKHDVLTILGLGSCIALTMYDNKLKIGGMAHIFLPKQNNRPNSSPAKFASDGVANLWQSLKSFGSQKENLQVGIGSVKFSSQFEKSKRSS